MSNISRRAFLKSSTISLAAFGLSPRSWAAVAGANSDVRVAVIGFRSQGAGHINSLRKLQGVRITALCDVDRRVLESKAKELGVTETYEDIRKLLESKNVDAVSIATPNHWHSLAAIWAVQAGKDVYVEKPISHNVWEGRKVVEASGKYKRIVQSGTQCRSSAGIAAAVQFVRSGKLGRVRVARGFCYKPRMSIGRTSGPQTVPDYINYDLWCGPAPLTPPRRNNPKFGPVHYDWHWFWAYGGGDLGNQGIHQVDIARWFLGEPKLAPFVMSVGGRLGYMDDAETPNTMVLYQGYAKAPLIFEVRGLPRNKDAQAAGWDKNMDAYRDVRIGCVIECEGGSMVVPSYTEAFAYDKDGKLIRKFETKDQELAGRLGLAAGSGDHHGNWIAAIRSRKPALLTAPIIEGHISSALCHTANISYRVGGRKQPGEIKEALQENKFLAEAYNRMAAHLDANGVDVTKDLVTLGAPLRFDTKTERFIGNDDANKLLTREYRPPFVVPEKV